MPTSRGMSQIRRVLWCWENEQWQMSATLGEFNSDFTRLLKRCPVGLSTCLGLTISFASDFRLFQVSLALHKPLEGKRLLERRWPHFWRRHPCSIHETGIYGAESQSWWLMPCPAAFSWSSVPHVRIPTVSGNETNDCKVYRLAGCGGQWVVATPSADRWVILQKRVVQPRLGRQKSKFNWGS